MDLTTTYLGLKLRSPLVVSASPLSEDVDNIRRMADAGADGGVVGLELSPLSPEPFQFGWRQRTGRGGDSRPRLR